MLQYLNWPKESLPAERQIAITILKICSKIGQLIADPLQDSVLLAAVVSLASSGTSATSAVTSDSLFNISVMWLK